MEWIDVNDYTPPNGPEYLVRIVGKDEMDNQYHYYEVIERFCGYWVIETDDEDAEVTHWAEIDEPTTDTDEENTENNR